MDLYYILNIIFINNLFINTRFCVKIAVKTSKPSKEKISCNLKKYFIPQEFCVLKKPTDILNIYVIFIKKIFLHWFWPIRFDIKFGNFQKKLTCSRNGGCDSN